MGEAVRVLAGIFGWIDKESSLFNRNSLNNCSSGVLKFLAQWLAGSFHRTGRKVLPRLGNTADRAEFPRAFGMLVLLQEYKI